MVHDIVIAILQPVAQYYSTIHMPSYSAVYYKTLRSEHNRYIIIEAPLKKDKEKREISAVICKTVYKINSRPECKFFYYIPKALI